MLKSTQPHRRRPTARPGVENHHCRQAAASPQLRKPREQPLRSGAKNRCGKGQHHSVHSKPRHPNAQQLLPRALSTNRQKRKMRESALDSETTDPPSALSPSVRGLAGKFTIITFHRHFPRSSEDPRRAAAFAPQAQASWAIHTLQCQPALHYS